MSNRRCWWNVEGDYPYNPVQIKANARDVLSRCPNRVTHRIFTTNPAVVHKEAFVCDTHTAEVVAGQLSGRYPSSTQIERIGEHAETSV